METEELTDLDEAAMLGDVVEHRWHGLTTATPHPACGAEGDWHAEKTAGARCGDCIEREVRRAPTCAGCGGPSIHG